jgi:hypothetical protein
MTGLERLSMQIVHRLGDVKTTCPYSLLSGLNTILIEIDWATSLRLLPFIRDPALNRGTVAVTLKFLGTVPGFVDRVTVNNVSALSPTLAALPDHTEPGL